MVEVGSSVGLRSAQPLSTRPHIQMGAHQGELATSLCILTVIPMTSISIWSCCCSRPLPPATRNTYSSSLKPTLFFQKIS